MFIRDFEFGEQGLLVKFLRLQVILQEYYLQVCNLTQQIEEIDPIRRKSRMATKNLH